MDLSVEGVRIHVGTGGRSFDPDIPAIVFIHGSGLDHTVWALPARYFAHHDASVLAVDLPGHGRSEGAPLTAIEAMADWVAWKAVSKQATWGSSGAAADTARMAARLCG